MRQASKMISVIVCTYNRSDSLKKTLWSLANMSIPADLIWELVVVDNNSYDNTKEVIECFIETSGLPVRYVFERKQGHSYARNRGVREAKSDIIAFTDDDCIADKYWVSHIVDEFLSDPSLSVLGGRVELYNQEDRPITIITHKERMHIMFYQQIFSHMVGCNMAFVRRVFDESGYFDTRFGAGTKIPCVEDWDFIYRSYKNGYKTVYSPNVLIYHNHGRRTDNQVNLLIKGYTIGRWAFYCKHAMRGDIDIARTAYMEIYWLFVGITKHLLMQKSIDRQKRAIRAILLGVIYWIRHWFRFV